ncbi:MAG: 2-amino-4-hydroxy-6-hydroxymethyldihydropteridine diphosphokinase [Chloroflexi bacterium]|nr:2-amino-4-hydroxy-6-hydroxymethyldihydropteridine diphosphokinase [Chloroflexota bacterium]
MATVYLSLGTNLGDRAANLEEARRRLGPRVRVKKVSPIYETAPWGILDQPDFLNQVVEGETRLSPFDLLAFVKAIERDMGRDPSEVRYGPRPIDIDILFYDDLEQTSETLTIPHPELAERAFTLVPLADLAPDLYIPAAECTVAERLKQLDLSGIRRYD